jgi:hypothetical protein
MLAERSEAGRERARGEKGREREIHCVAERSEARTSMLVARSEWLLQTHCNAPSERNWQYGMLRFS